MGGADSKRKRAEEEEREAAKRHELEEKELKEHDALMWEDFWSSDFLYSSLTIPFTMGGADSKRKRAEKEKREAASAKRREIKEKDVKERLALMRGYVSDFFRRAEEEKKREAAKRRELREKELKEHIALMEEDLSDIIFREYVRSYERRPNISRAEEEREAAKRREIREKELKEHIALMEQIVSPLKPRPNILLRAMEKREDPSAMRREIMELLEEHNALVGEDLWNYEHGPISRREHLWPYEPGSISLRPFSIPEKIRAGSPASSSESTMSNRSMTLPVSVKRTEEEKREDPSAKRPEIRELLEEHQALMREYLWIHEPDDDLLLREHVGYLEPRPLPLLRSKSCPEKMRAASPASSCGSMRSARSMDFPFSFKRDEEEKREDPSAKRPEIRKLKLEEDRVVLIREYLSPFEPGPFFSRQDFWPHDHGPNISSHVLRRKEQFLLHRAMVHDE